MKRDKSVHSYAQNFLSCSHGVGGCFHVEGSVPTSLLTKMKVCDPNTVSSLSVFPNPCVVKRLVCLLDKQVCNTE